MGYLIKSNVINALEEDMQDTMMCYEGKREKDIIAFCYKQMRRTIEELPQYWPDDVVEDTGLTTEQIRELKERDTAKAPQLEEDEPVPPELLEDGHEDPVEYIARKYNIRSGDFDKPSEIPDTDLLDT